MCKYCKNYFKDITELKPGEITMTQHARYIEVGSERTAQTVPMRFCPNCGANLLEQGQKVSYLVKKEIVVDDMIARIKEYDSSKPRMDELKFVNKIVSDYSVTRAEAIEMVQYIRRIFL